MDVDDLVKRAAEAAKHAPEHLQEAAFNRAFEALVRAQEGKTRSKRSPPSAARRSSKAEASRPSDERSDLLNRLDRTAHTEITDDTKALDNALLVLRAVHEDLGIDGLSAPEIAEILVDKFRCRVTRRSVARALNGAGQYVNRHKEGQRVIFRLMAAGERYLEELAAGSPGSDTEAAAPGSKSKRKKGRAARSAKKKTGSSVGPTAAMTVILDDGFFSSPRTIRDMIEKLKHDRGRTFKANQLSPVLVRWLRAGKLNRTKNADGQYEYTEA